MQFAHSQIYGGAGKRCARALGDFASSSRLRSKVSARDAMFVRLFVNLLQSEKPWKVEAFKPGHAVIIIDACYERDAKDWECELGAVFTTDPFTGIKQYFSLRLHVPLRYSCLIFHGAMS